MNILIFGGSGFIGTNLCQLLNKKTDYTLYIFDKKISKLKDKEVEEIIFQKYLRATTNAKNGNQSLANFFSKK